MYKIQRAFTFIELIVVVTILAILSTISFMAYQKYMQGARDSVRIVQLNEVSEGLRNLSFTARLPLPNNMVALESGSGTFNRTFAYQGDLSKEITLSIGFNGNVEDPEYSGIFPTYMLSESRKNFQLLTFIQDSKNLTTFIPSTFADSIDYLKMFPKIQGDPLGILIDKNTQTPLQKLQIRTGTGIYNIITGTGNLQAFFSDTKTLSNTSNSLLEMLPNASCKRILDMGNSHGNDIYTITPNGYVSFPVYCDMVTDGGGWTLVARSVVGAPVGSGFGWLVQRGNVSDDSQPYSLGLNLKEILFEDILFAGYDRAKKPEKIAWKLRGIDRNIIVNSSTGAMNHSDCVNIITTLSGSSTICDASNPNWRSWGQITDNSKYYISWNTTTKTGLGLYHDTFRIEVAGTTIPGMVFIR